MSDLEELDVGGLVRHARRELSDSDYRRKYRAGDFVQYSAKQRGALNSNAVALYFKAGNQSGKTTAGCAKVVFMTTQLFPPWYTGWKQPKLNLIRPYTMVVWMLAPTSQMVRDGVQLRLLGDVAGGQLGTGLMPLENIVSVQNARGISGLVDSVVIRRADGTNAVIRFKTYEQGREALQSEAVDLLIYDEMPTALELWTEGIARTTATSGRMWLTATPLKQFSPVAQWFREPNHPDRETILMTADDAAHLTDEQRAQMKASYSPLELQTRYYGQDWAGAGLVFSMPTADISEDTDPADFPFYYRWMIAIDLAHFGASEAAHPFAAVLCCFDPDKNVLHVVDTVRIKGALPETHVSMIWEWPVADQAPVVWPHDGNAGTGNAIGETYASRYRKLGLNMLGQHATFTDGGYAFEPGIDLMDQMLRTGKLRVARSCRDWFDEYLMYSRDDKGLVVKIRDDLLSATRLACMMTRAARIIDQERPKPAGPFAKRRNRPSYKMTEDWDPWTGKPEAGSGLPMPYRGNTDWDEQNA